jgi:hypothetical protein
MNIQTALDQGNYTIARASRAGLASNAESTRRLELLWAWASLLVLIVCWDAAARLDQRVSLPRMRYETEVTRGW